MMDMVGCCSLIDWFRVASRHSYSLGWLHKRCYVIPTGHLAQITQVHFLPPLLPSSLLLAIDPPAVTMKLWTAWLFLLSIVSVVAQSSSDAKLEKFQALSHSGPVELDAAAFDELTSKPRDYYAAVILTARDVRYGCAMCREFQPEWELISRSWNRGDKPDGLNVVFGTLDFDQGRMVFQKVRTETRSLPFFSR